MPKSKPLSSYYKGPTDEIDCHGEAHSNPHIDNCMICAPKWGKIAVPAGCKDIEAAREIWRRWKLWTMARATERRLKKLRGE